jgi:DNA polymerase-3 subunit gamma/tau
MSYLALARKYRPETFADVVGQSPITRTLRAAQRKGKLSHAYLFAGPRGCGKTTVARLLAKALNCAETRDGDPCGRCEVCRGIAQGTFLDVLEIDAASHTGVDNVRELRDMAQYTPSAGHSRVFIIDEVHMLSKGAFNALLKILEEPPARVFFFFATTEPNKVPRTVLSRCQRFDFRLIGPAELGERLDQIARSEGHELTPAARRVLVSLAEGSLRDGISLLDQALAACDETIDEEDLVALFGLVRSEVYIDLNAAILAHDAAAGLRLVDGLVGAGQSLDVFAGGMVANFRNLMLLRIDPELAPAVGLATDLLARLRAQAESWSVPDLLALLDRAIQYFERIHRSTQPRILLEAAVVEFCHFESRVLLADLISRLDALDGAPGTGGGGTATGRGDGSRRSTGAHRASAAGGPTVEHASAAAGAATTIPGWTDLVRSLLESHPGLAACLMEALPSVDEARSRLTLAFARDKSFQMKRLTEDQTVLADRVATVWGRQLRIELVAADAASDHERKESLRREVAPNDREILERACDEDRSLGRLVDLLHGQPLPESEREKWRRPDAAAPDAADPDET